MTPRSLPLLLLAFAGCPQPVQELPLLSDAGASVDAGAAVDAGSMTTPDSGIPTRNVTWTRCPLHSEGTLPWAECATVPLPLDAANPTGPTIDVFVKRWRPAGGRGLRALWMLQGGPGASGYAFEGLSEQLATRFPDVDYYFPDHRGTGRSTRLGCSAEEEDVSEGGLSITETEWPTCLATVTTQFGTRLQSFNTTNAANDLGILIESTRREGQPVFVYGVSYGTSWLHRYVQLFPQQVDGVVFDSIAAPGMSLFRQDEDANEAARDFLGACAADTFCRSKLGPDPWAKAVALFAKLKTGHCSAIAVPDAPTNVLLRRAFGSFLMDPSMRAYLPAIIHRVDRCEPRDVGALQKLMQALTQPGGTSEFMKQWSWVLAHNIITSEFNESPPPTKALLQSIRDGAVASRDITEQLEVHLGTWPSYAPGPLATQWADSSMPMLFLQGGLDPATLLRKARVMKPHFTRPNQTWVELPTATHTTLASSPYVNEAGERRSCGTRLLMSFIEAPTASLDVSCAQKVVPLDFTLPRTEVNQALFGTNDAWE